MTDALVYDRVDFAYPGGEPVLRQASLAVPEGAFALLVGATGSGKSTLLRLAKPEVAPAGELTGSIRLFGVPAAELGPVASARSCGYVFQNPDAQIVCDTVWHEMAFGLENLGVPESQMRRRVAETCNFFGMEPWFRAHTAELSGGQRQLLALAATLAMRPRLLLLDEPTSMLDPVAEQAFLGTLFRVNRELGITVLVATHAPWTMAAYATCAYAIEDGRVRPVELACLRQEPKMGEKDGPMCGSAAGAAARAVPAATPGSSAGTVPAAEILELDDVWYRYGRDSRWVLRGLDLTVAAGEVRALIGSNGCGKSTLLKTIAGVQRPWRGRVRNTAAQSQVLLPQSPKALFSQQTVYDELMAWSKTSGAYGEAEVGAVLEELGLAGSTQRHPYDLSGGQQQLLALKKLLLVRPRLLLLDEPTKGLDLACRRRVAELVLQAAKEGATVVVATHDLAFVRAVADSVTLLFDGQAISTQAPAEYFADALGCGFDGGIGASSGYGTGSTQERELDQARDCEPDRTQDGV